MKTIYFCLQCNCVNLMRDAYVSVNDPEDVHTFDDVCCPNCGYDGHTYGAVEVSDDFVIDHDFMAPELRANAREEYI